MFRELNEQISKLHETFDLDDHRESFVCECGNGSCTEAVMLTLAEYESVRAHPRRFLIARNHENPEVERVVDENGDLTVVETFVGEASRIAEETDPRLLSPSY